MKDNKADGLEPSATDALLAQADPEYTARIQADRVSAAWRTGQTPTSPQMAIEELPLFGGARQMMMF
jgi:hypothetical protein